MTDRRLIFSGPLVAIAAMLLAGCGEPSPKMRAELAQQGRVNNAECVGNDKAFTTSRGGIFVVEDHKDCAEVQP